MYFQLNLFEDFLTRAISSLLLISIFFTFCPASIHADVTFTNQSEPMGTNNGVSSGAVEWSDYDNDGDLDIALSGTDGSNQRLIIFRNDNTGFTQVSEPMGSNKGLNDSSIDWGDFDSDGDLDLVVSGEDNSFDTRLIIFRNDNGSFNSVAEPMGANKGVRRSSIEWGDYDNDGDLDLAVSGIIKSTMITTKGVLRIYENQGGDFGEAAEPMGSSEGLRSSSLDWGDFDSDGDLDLVVSGIDNTTTERLIIYENVEGDFKKTSEPMGSGKGVGDSSVHWGDFDNDGDLDLTVSGDDGSNNRLIVFRNDGGSFTKVAEPMGTDKGVKSGSVEWSDYDNEGDLDLAVLGQDGSPSARFLIFRNDSGSFAKIQEPLALEFSDLDWGDYDGDGDLDLVGIGDDGSNKRLVIFESDATSSAKRNSRPPYPDDLITSRSDTKITFHWESVSGDTVTPEESISYNLRVGTGPEAVNIKPADTYSDKIGSQLIGNTGLGESIPLNGFQTDSFPIYWSVQAVDGGKMRSKWAPVQSFKDHGLNNKSFSSKPDTVESQVSSFKFQLGFENGSPVFESSAFGSGDTLLIHTQKQDSGGINIETINPAYNLDTPIEMKNALALADSKLIDQSFEPVSNDILSLSLWKNSLDSSSAYLGGKDTLAEDVIVDVQGVNYDGDTDKIRVMKLMPNGTRWAKLNTNPRVNGQPGTYTVSFTVKSDTDLKTAGFSLFRIVENTDSGGSSSGTCLLQRVGTHSMVQSHLRELREQILTTKFGRSFVSWYYEI